jgi:hypothetical protein
MNSFREIYKNEFSKIHVRNQVIENIIAKAEESYSSQRLTSYILVRRSHRKVFITVIATFIAIILSATAVFAIPGVKEVLQRIFGSGAIVINSSVQKQYRVANKNYAISVEGMIKNAQDLWLVLSIQGLNDESKKNLDIKNFYAIKADEILSSVDIVNKPKNSIVEVVNGMTNHTWNTDSEKYILMHLSTNNVKDGDKITLRFLQIGMDLTFPIVNNVNSIYFDTKNIDYADGGSISELSITPFTFNLKVKKYVTKNLNQIQQGEQYRIIANQMVEDWNTLVIVYKDGTKIEPNVRINSDGNRFTGGSVDNDGFFNISEFGVFNNMIDLQKVEHIELNGISYKVLK